MNKRISLLYAILLVLMIFAPTLRWLSKRSVDGNLSGYTDNIPKPPLHTTMGFFDKSSQRWLERYYEVHLGFRALLVRSFNELNFLLFREAPRLRLVSTPEHGLYSGMSIDNLNDEVARKVELETLYGVEAKKLLQIQNWLKAKGKHFEVIIASSKPYIYPEGLGNRYLLYGQHTILDRAANFGNILKKIGVNVIDTGPLLRHIVKQTEIDTHPHSGVHWNYYAGCIVAKQLYENIRTKSIPNVPTLECGEPRYEEPHLVDIDGLLLLNIWSGGNLIKPTPYPALQSVNQSKWNPSIVFIGDSFSDQIRDAIKKAKIYSRMITSGYFRTREVDIEGGLDQITHGVVADEKAVREKLEQDIAASDIVVLQMVDYNVQRWGYGFADYFLNRLIDESKQIQIESKSGVYSYETDGKNWWHWIESKGTFELQPFNKDQQASQTKLHFEYGTRGKQNLKIVVRGRDGSTQQFVMQSQRNGLATFDKLIDFKPNELVDFSIETDGVATQLSNKDHRKAAFIIRNINITPFVKEE